MRERVCDELEEKGVRTVCAEGIIEKDLSESVCAADVIFVLPYYRDSSLATHRIDPLLLAGKPVVTVHSNDLDLDRVYEGAVIFVSEEEVADVTAEIVRAKEKERMERGRGSEGARERGEGERESEKGNGQFSIQNKDLSSWMRKKIQDIQPLCFALHSLPSHFPST